MDLTQELVRELFECRDGALYWRKKASNKMPGSLAGCVTTNGYWVVRINKKLHGAHRVIFLMHHGYMPAGIDHHDRDTLNNRIGNLRPATDSENGCNKVKQANNKSGFKGVSWHKGTQKWMGRICIGGKLIHLGLHETPEAAAAAYAEAAARLHGDFARTT